MTNNDPIRVLFIDDDDELRALMRRFFEKNGLILFDLPDTDNLIHKINIFHPHVIILDIMLPGEDGLETLKRLRQNNCNLPIILLSARNEAIDKILGLESGADDYIGKPFVAHELLARIKAVLRRDGNISYNPGGRINIGDYKVDLGKKILIHHEEPIRLSNIEFSTLEVLATNLNNVVSRNQLIEKIYGFMSNISERTTDVLIWRIRQIIEPNPSMPTYLKTIRGCGYMLKGELENASH